MTQRQIKRELFRKKRLQQQKVIVQKDKAYNNVNAMIVNAQSGASVVVTDAVNAIHDLYQVTIKQTKSHEYKYALFALSIGRLMNELKQQIKKQKLGKWLVWSQINLSFIGVRTRQDWMRLAQENGIIQYTHLGISALIIILTAIDDLYSKGKFVNRFHAFFQESSYPYQEYAKTVDVKKLIAIHVFEVKAKREGLVLNIDLVKPLGEYPLALTDNLIEEMLQHQHTGSDVAVANLLKLYIMGKGRNPKLSGNTKTKSKQISIYREINKLDRTLDYYGNNFHKLGELRMEDIIKIQVNLKNKISKLYWEKLIFDVMEN
jgi:hypothetical protein